MEEKSTENIRENEEVSLKELIRNVGKWYRYLLSKWLIILICGISGCILGAAYALFKKPTYTAMTTFVLDESDKSSGGLGQYAGLASMVGIDIGGGGGTIFQGDNILELYRSRKMIQKTLLTEVDFEGKKSLLIDRYIDFNDLRDKWSKKPELRNIKFSSTSSSIGLKLTRLQDSILGTVVNSINKDYQNVSKPDKKLSLIKAVVNAKDELFAKKFNEEIVKNVNDFYIQTKTKKSVENVAILQEKTDSVRSVMNRAIYTGAAVADATPNLNVTRQVQRLAPIQRSQFTAEANKGILAELVKNLELSKISLLKETPLIQVIDQPILPLENNKLGLLKGIIFGGIIGGFLIVVILTARRVLKSILEE